VPFSVAESILLCPSEGILEGFWKNVRTMRMTWAIKEASTEGRIAVAGY